MIEIPRREKEFLVFLECLNVVVSLPPRAVPVVQNGMIGAEEMAELCEAATRRQLPLPHASVFDRKNSLPHLRDRDCVVYVVDGAVSDA